MLTEAMVRTSLPPGRQAFTYQHLFHAGWLLPLATADFAEVALKTSTG